SPDDVRAARAMINPYFTESKLNGLDQEDLVVLLSTAFCLRDGLYASLLNVMTRYSVLAETYRMHQMDRQKFYRIVSRLETYGLIESRLEGRGDKKGVEKVLMINDVPLDALSEKIESILSAFHDLHPDRRSLFLSFFFLDSDSMKAKHSNALSISLP
ncbi:cell division control protein 6 related protein, partial [mine drainage metagenome]